VVVLRSDNTDADKRPSGKIRVSMYSYGVWIAFIVW
jgi:hypothetical protein